MQNLEKLTASFLRELIQPDGKVLFDKYPTPEIAAAKILEFRMLLSMLSPEAGYLLEKFDNDISFDSEDVKVRLRTLVVYCRTTLKLLRGKVIQPRSTLIPAPDISRLTESTPGLEDVLVGRWKEAQLCQRAGAYLSTILLIGSILEALLLSRAMLSPGDATRAKRAPVLPDGKQKALQDWKLNELISVALELGWMRTDYADFDVALRKFRLLIHPWGEVSAKIDLSIDTCNKCWRVLDKTIDDILKSA